jgi:hypothetical protein
MGTRRYILKAPAVQYPSVHVTFRGGLSTLDIVNGSAEICSVTTVDVEPAGKALTEDVEQAS